MASLDLIITAKDHASGTLKSVDKAAGGLGRTMGGVMKVGAVAGVAALGGLAVVGVSCVKAAMEQQKADAQLAAVLKSTGGAAGVTAEQVKGLAGSLQKTTPYGDDVIQTAQNLLLTFTRIGKDTFPGATEATLDMATALGEDTSAAAMRLGKALNDPIKGVGALRRVGVRLTDQQGEQIAIMMKAGDVAGAQAVILSELTNEFGGSAKAAGETFAGKLAILKNAVGEVQEAIGFALLPILTKLATWFAAALPSIIAFAEKGFDALKEKASVAFGYFKAEVLPILKDIGDWFKEHPKAIKMAAVALGVVLVGFFTAWAVSAGVAAAATLAAAAPFIALVAAVAAIGAAFYLLEKETGFFSEILLPIVKEVAAALIDFFAPALDTLADLWENLKGPLATVGQALLDVGKTAGNFLLPILEKVGKFLLKHKPILIGVAAAILLLVAPWLAVVAAIAVVLAKWDEISAFFIGIGETISNFVTGAIETITGLPVIGAIVTDTFNQIKITVETVFGVVKLLISAALDSIKNLFDFWKAIFTGDWDAAWNAVKAQFEVIINLLAGIFGIALDAVKAMLASKLEMVKGIGSDLGNLIVGAAAGIWNGLAGLFSTAINAVATWLSGAAGAVTAIGTSLGNLILAGAGAIWNTITSAFSGAVNAIGTWIDGAIGTITGWGSKIGTAIYNGIRSGFGQGEDLAKLVVNLVIDILNGVTGSINAFLPNEIGAIKAFGQTIFPGIDLPDNPIPPISPLYRGGIVTRPTLALLGERGPEVVTPLGSPSGGAALAIDYDQLARVLVRAFAGVRIEMDGREVGRIQGAQAWSLARGG